MRRKDPISGGHWLKDGIHDQMNEWMNKWMNKWIQDWMNTAADNGCRDACKWTPWTQTSTSSISPKVLKYSLMSSSAKSVATPPTKIFRTRSRAAAFTIKTATKKTTVIAYCSNKLLEAQSEMRARRSNSYVNSPLYNSQMFTTIDGLRGGTVPATT